MLIEFKFSESLNASAVRQLLVYDHLYRSANALDDTALRSVLICARTPQKGVLTRLGFELSENRGVYISKLPLLGCLQVILLNELVDRPHNAVLKTFASRIDEYKKAFSTINCDRFSRLSQTFSQTVAGLRRLRMGEIALDTESEEWTPEFLMELGKEWIEEVTLEHTLQKGIQKGEAALLLRLLQRRFSPLPDWVAEKLLCADQTTLQIWGDRILDANSLEEVFTD